jgi:hypothetical protein
MKPLICYPKGQNSGICNTELYNYAQYLDVLSSEIIEKNLYKICILYIKDTSNETSFI